MIAARQFACHVRSALGLAAVHHVTVELFGSLSATGVGHGTDTAVLLGLAGHEPDHIDPDQIAPTIADIRESVARSMAEARGELTPGEAWGRVLSAVRKCGDNDPRQVDRARAELGDLWETVKLIGGWSYLCNTDDDISTLSAQFERRYKAVKQQEQYRTQVPQAVQDHLKALGAAQGLKMIGGDSNS